MTWEKVWATTSNNIRPVKVDDNQRLTGTVKFFLSGAGYGFILHNEAEYFVHYSEIKQEGFRDLKTGDVVEFSPVDHGRGLKAIDVVVIRSA